MTFLSVSACQTQFFNKLSTNQFNTNIIILLARDVCGIVRMCYLFCYPHLQLLQLSVRCFPTGWFTFQNQIL